MSELGTTPLKTFFDGVAFLNKYPLLSKATSSEDGPTSGYLLSEITKITFESESHQHHLLEYLINRLNKESPTVRFKTLKILHHVAKHGHRQFYQSLRKKDGALKDAADYTSTGDGVKNQEIYVNIRNEAQNVLLYIFSSEAENARNPVSSEQDGVEPGLSSQPASLQLSGMGSSMKSGKYDGFGNAPIQAQKTVTEKVVGSLSDAMEKLMTPPESNEDRIHKVLSTDTGAYQPVKVSTSSDALAYMAESTVSKASYTSSRRKQKRAHKPGKAGGGWEEEEDRDDDSGCPEQKSSQHSIMSSDSLERFDLSSPSDWSAEITLTEEYLTSCKESMPSRALVQLVFKRSTSLNCDKVLELMNSRLLESSVSAQMSILLYIEAVLQNDLVPVDLLAASLHHNLTQLMADSRRKVQIKATKILLILEMSLDYLRNSTNTETQSPDSAVKSPSVDLEELTGRDSNTLSQSEDDTLLAKPDEQTESCQEDDHSVLNKPADTNDLNHSLGEENSQTLESQGQEAAEEKDFKNGASVEAEESPNSSQIKNSVNSQCSD